MSSALVTYVKRGLKNQYMPSEQCWSFIYHVDGRQNPNESLPAWDTFYSLNVILGLAALGKEAWEGEYDLPAMLQLSARRMFERPVPTYALGMALWAAAQLNVPLEADTAKRIRDFIKDRSNWSKFRAQDAGLILTGIAEQKARGNNEYDDDAHELFKFIKTNYLTSSKLFYDEPSGFRKNFSSFATQTYLTTACYHYGERYNNQEALTIADESTKKIMSLQGPMGEWPWFYFSPKGIVVDNYEVYSVHQGGMAALFLSFAEKRNIPGAREAIIKGFDWIFGNNQLKVKMMAPEVGMTIRSIIREGELHNKKKRMIRAIINGLLGRSDTYASPSTLTLRKECRSYELGWMLYSFGNRTDLPQILEHQDFVNANRQA